MMLSNPTNSILLSPTTATLTIIDNNNPPGDFVFSSPTYSVSETGTNAVITVLRTNGTAGQISVNIATSDGTATAGANYVATNANLTFEDGVTSQTFVVPVLYVPQVEGNLTVNLTLSNPSTNTQIIGANPATLTILDANVGVGFVQPFYFINDTNGILTLGVQRIGNTNNAFSVSFATANGTATAGTDYVATNGTLSFAGNETFQTLNVNILSNAAFSNRIFLVNLSNPSSPAQLISNSTTSVTVVATNVGLEFSTNSIAVEKSGGDVTVTVLRVGSAAEPLSVNFATEDGTALANTNYVPTNGLLSFAPGQVSNSFNVGIIPDGRVDPDLTFTNLLLNPVNAQLLFPSNQTVTISNDTAGFSFSSPAYSVSENGVSAAITVLRTGFIDNTNTVLVNYATANGSAQAGTQYLATNGTLAFTNGQTSATFVVPIIDRNVTGGSETVLLNLSSPSPGEVLVNPNAATLTILNNDGSLIVPAGAALTGGSTNGAINPGETVTLLFALRNVAGSNTANLTATLLATNGVTAPVPTTPVSYGVLVTNGPSVSRSFTFTAGGTNGSQILATLQLQDGATNLGTATFTFTVGTATNSFTNNSLIVINDDAPASTPYPSVLNVSGIVGTVSKVTVTVSNLNHTSISDVGMLLGGPTGTNTLLMGNVGSGDVANLDLTFDDSGPALTGSLPVSGTYRPTQFVTFVPFPVSTNGPALLPKPFGTTLSVFTNSNPNGTWLLYVIDDVQLNSGNIANGWSLNISTLGVISPTVNLVTGITASPNPVVVSSNLTYTHYRLQCRPFGRHRRHA
jgi:hypothetical protein